MSFNTILQSLEQQLASLSLRRPVLHTISRTPCLRHQHTAAEPAKAAASSQPTTISFDTRAQKLQQQSSQPIAPSISAKRRSQLVRYRYDKSPNHYHTLQHLDNLPQVDEQGVATASDFTPTLQRPFAWLRTDSPTVQPMEWSETSKRSGLIGEKVGMLQLWTKWGEQVTCTVLRIPTNHVTQLKNEISPSGYIGLQLGSGNAKPKNLSKALIAHYKKAGVHPKRYLHEFQVTPDAVVPVGHQMDVRHFTVGQHVDVTGTTIGKGFAGGMKRHNFGGLLASHGVSVSHRSVGGMGGAQDPGRVFKGKRMPGRMGGVQRTMQNLQVYKIDTQRQLIYVKGHVIGHAGNWVIVKDAAKKPFALESPPPFPTYIASEHGRVVTEETLPASDNDPLEHLLI